VFASDVIVCDSRKSTIVSDALCTNMPYADLGILIWLMAHPWMHEASDLEKLADSLAGSHGQVHDDRENVLSALHRLEDAGWIYPCTGRDPGRGGYVNTYLVAHPDEIADSDVPRLKVMDTSRLKPGLRRAHEAVRKAERR